MNQEDNERNANMKRVAIKILEVVYTHGILLIEKKRVAESYSKSYATKSTQKVESRLLFRKCSKRMFVKLRPIFCVL